MSWSLYLLNDTIKVYLQAGKVDGYEFVNRVNDIIDCIDNMDDVEICYDTCEKKITELTVDDVCKLTKIVSSHQKLIASLELIRLEAILLYHKWSLQGDTLRLLIDPKIEDYKEI